MKVTLLLLACLVGVSYAQRYIWPMPYAPRAHLLPLFYADGKPAHFENLPQVQVSRDKGGNAVHIVVHLSRHQY